MNHADLLHNFRHSLIKRLEDNFKDLMLAVNALPTPGWGLKVFGSPPVVTNKHNDPNVWIMYIEQGPTTNYLGGGAGNKEAHFFCEAGYFVGSMAGTNDTNQKIEDKGDLLAGRLRDLIVGDVEAAGEVVNGNGEISRTPAIITFYTWADGGPATQPVASGVIRVDNVNTVPIQDDTTEKNAHSGIINFDAHIIF